MLFLSDDRMRRLGSGYSASPVCPLCDGKSGNAFGAADWNLEVTRETFEYFRCEACGCVFTFPVPGDLGRYYPSHYAAYEARSKPCTESGLEQAKLEIVRKHIAGKRLLEIGPGSGKFLRMARDGGFQVEAIEMDESCCRYLNEEVGIPTIHSSDIVASLATLPSYDGIVLWHVIEHLSSPRSVMEHLSNHLAPGGILVLAAPNPKSLQFRFFSKYWVHLDAPRHLVLIPLPWLSEVGLRLGLKTISASTKDKVCRYFTNEAWFEASFKNAQQGLPTGKPDFLMPPPIIRALLYHFVFKPVENIQGLGSTYTMIFRKVPAIHR